MREQQSIRDQLISVAINACESGDAVWVRDAEAIADAITASPVIRRVQADALRDAALSGAFGTGAQSTLLARADRIEGAQF